MVCWPRGKPLHSTERAKDVTVHYRWHPLYGQMARVNRSLPIANGELLFCELPDGTRGTLPAWMTDAAACAVLTVGALFDLDVLACPRCGGRLRVIATIQDRAVARTILAHLGRAFSPERPGPAPPAPASIP